MSTFSTFTAALRSQLNQGTLSCFLLVPGFVLLASCQSIRGPEEVQVDEIIFRNLSDTPVQQVTLRIPDTGKIFACAYIPPGTDCSIGFHPLTARGNDTILSWEQHRHRYQKYLNNNKEVLGTAEHPLSVIITLSSQGGLTIMTQATTR